MNNDDNLSMAGGRNVNESPLPDEMAGGAAGGEMANNDFVSIEELAELRAKASKADENWDKYVRLSADMDNFKKRAARERTEAVRYANEAVLEKLLPVVDNFEAALGAATASSGNVDALRTGIQMIYTQLKSYLAEAGVEEVDALNKPFDPNQHEAVSQQATEDAPEGQVVQQMRKGYKFRERLIRPAMVVVAKKP